MRPSSPPLLREQARRGGDGVVHAVRVGTFPSLLWGGSAIRQDRRGGVMMSNAHTPPSPTYPRPLDCVYNALHLILMRGGLQVVGISGDEGNASSGPG